MDHLIVELADLRAGNALAIHRSPRAKAQSGLHCSGAPYLTNCDRRGIELARVRGRRRCPGRNRQINSLVSRGLGTSQAASNRTGTAMLIRAAWLGPPP